VGDPAVRPALDSLAVTGPGPERQGPLAARVSRRSALLAVGGAAVGAGATGAAWAVSGAGGGTAALAGPAGIPPDADLMREHGVLKRVLLCYAAMTANAQAGGQLDAGHVHDSALVIHDYIEGFHEGLEEGYVFPRLRPGPLAGTVTTLLEQHARGRVITQFLLAHATPKDTADAATRARLASAMSAFNRMYQPHEAREDTVLFPALRQAMAPQEFTDLGAHFARLEQQQFGPGEFTAMVDKVAGIEQALGIYDLASFTPDVTQYAADLGQVRGSLGP
jgi:hemerythrin-like domain-containing protein